MAGLSTVLTKGFKAEAAVPRRRIIKFGGSDGAVVLATGPADNMFAISAEIDAAINEPCDGHLLGIAEVEYGGNVTRGDWLTSDAVGRAVAAAPAAGANANVIGKALASGVLGDVGVSTVNPGRIQG